MTPIPSSVGQLVLFTLADWLGIDPMRLEAIIQVLGIPWPWNMG